MQPKLRISSIVGHPFKETDITYVKKKQIWIVSCAYQLNLK